jgi:hypothetical protein
VAYASNEQITIAADDMSASVEVSIGSRTHSAFVHTSERVSFSLPQRTLYVPALRWLRVYCCVWRPFGT